MSESSTPQHDVAAGIVAFRPDPDQLLALARAAAREAAPVVVVANSALDDTLREALLDIGAQIVDAPCNLGVAEAFNICALIAMLAGKRRLLLLDQDSDLPRGAVARLSASLDVIAERGETPAVVGPAIVAPEGEANLFKPPRYFRRSRAVPVGHCQAVHYVISSGSLIDLQAFRQIGRFRSDFFIDAVDTEWCFRAWAKGASCWVDRGVRMPHRIGRGVVKTKLGPAIPRQADFRLYAYVRNQAYCLTLAHVPALWKLRIGAHLARTVMVYWLDQSRSRSFLQAMAQAWRDGRVGKLGPPPGVEGAMTL